MLCVSVTDESFATFLNSALFHYKSAGVSQALQIVGFVRAVNK